MSVLSSAALSVVLLPACSSSAVEQFIRSKYERKLYMSREKSTASKTTQAKTTVAKTTVAKTTQAKRENVKSSKKTPTSSSHKTSEQV